MEELQHIATAEPERVQELKRTSTFLQKPQRPVPQPKSQQPEEEDGETYKVVIKKQDKKTVIARLVEKGLLPPGTEIPRTPEPPYEVKMHETENNLEEDSPESNPNPSCSTLPSATIDDDSLSPRFPALDPNESRSLKTQPTSTVSYICNSKLLHARSSSHQAPANKYAKKVAPRPSKCARAHYAERILLRNVSIFGLCSETPRLRKTRVFVSKRVRTRGRYMATCLKRESARLISLLTMLCQFLRKRDASQPNEATEVRKRRLSLKGHYLENVLQKNVAPVLQCVKETCLVVGDRREVGNERQDEPKSTKTKGRYVEKCLHRQNLRLRCALASLLDRAKSSLDNNLFAISRSLRAKRCAKARYFEKLVRKNLEMLELLAGYVCSKVSEWLEDGPTCLSRKESTVVVGNCSWILGDSIPAEREIESSVSAVKSSEWHDDGSSCSSQKEPPVIAGACDAPVPNKEKTDESACNVVECDVDPASSEEASREILNLSQATDQIADEEPTFSRFLQSTENYISAEVFHRGSRRFSRPRRSLDTIVPKEDKDTFSKLLQSTEDYISAEMFHRGSRRLSRPRKSVDIVRKEDDVFSKLLQSTENYISAEVFHRGGRRLSRRLSKDVGLEQGVLSNFLRSTGDYVSSEVFHRRSRRLSRSSKKDISCTTPIWWGGLKSMCMNLPWFSLRVTEKSAEYADVCAEKIDPEIERDGRRLSFVPTILYQGLTNHIGVDFTRLVAYAFVPCTSIILLYLYK